MKIREEIEMQYSSGSLRAAWRGIKTVASINQCAKERKQSISVNGADDSDLPNHSQLIFFSCFERSEFSESRVPSLPVYLFKRARVTEGCWP